MKLGLRQIFTLVAAFFFARIMPAQEIPKMPEDPAIVKGLLPNGMTYYIASNSSEKGLADFSLIQKTGRRNVAGSPEPDTLAYEMAKDALTSLPRLAGQSPQSFFLRHGSAPGPDGYVSVRDDATIYRFAEVRVGSGKAVLDSSLLALMDITDRVTFSDDSLFRHWYSPADQAIVIAGDIDAKSVAMKLEAISYMIPALPSQERSLPESAALTGITLVPDGELQKISVSWASQRIPDKYMNTVQPVIFDMSMDLLGRIAVSRVRSLFRSEEIPVADVSYSHMASNSYPYDDIFSISAAVNARDATRAGELLSEIMNSIGSVGVTLDEYLLAEAGFMQELKIKAERPLKANKDYVDRCIASFLYNSFLSSPKQVLAFHSSRNIPDTTRCRLFNGVAAGLLSPSQPVRKAAADSVSDQRKYLSLPGPGPKVRVRSARRDPISGGTVWTFSNNFKVVYKKIPSIREVYYCLALNGGYAGIRGLSAGESAFVSDVFSINKIAGIRGDEFMERLKMEGLVMEPQVTMSNTLVEGYVGKDNLPLMLKALLAVANESSANEEDFPYYRKCEEISLSRSDDSRLSRIVAIDSIMCPNYRYSPYKSKGALTASFHSTVTGFIDAQMQKMNDGILVIVGDLDEEYLKQQLLMYVGGFRTKDAESRRAIVRYQPISGTSTYVLRGQKETLDVALSARMPVTSDNYYAASVAMMLLEQELARELAGLGVSVDLSYNFRIYPEERLNLIISVLLSDNEDFECLGDSLDALGLVRRTLSGLSSMDIVPEDISHFKAYQKNLMDQMMKDPVYWVDAIAVRYLDGKDLTTGYVSRIDNISADKVKEIFSYMSKGCKVEYVVSR